MQLVLDISNSLEFWRRFYPASRRPSGKFASVPRECATNENDVARLAPDWLTSGHLPADDGRIHALCFAKQARRKSHVHVVHVWTGPIPQGSFYQLNSQVLVASPEFIFLAAASMLELPALIALGDELCGRYSFDASQKRGFRTRAAPITTIAQLSSYLDGARGCRGIRLARMALPYLIENSASPMETTDELLMCLPYRLGGYGLWKPHINHEVSLAGKAAYLARRNTCYADMCWPDATLDVEYHGKYDHADADAQLSDRARVLGLREAGFEVIELTHNQVQDLRAFEYVVTRIAKIIGKPIRKEMLGALPARLQLRHMLFDWNRSSGQIR